jgi:hypothetical protein
MIKSKQIPIVSLVNLLIVNSDCRYSSRRFIRHSRSVKIFAGHRTDGSHLRAVLYRYVFIDTAVREREEISFARLIESKYDVASDTASACIGSDLDPLSNLQTSFRSHVHT